MNVNPTQAAGVALKMAANRFVGYQTTPQTRVRVKKAFIEIMRDHFGIDWSRDSWRIQVFFIDGQRPDVRIPPHLLNA